MMYSIFGISFQTLSNVNDLFDAISVDEDGALYESKETYTHKEDGLTFDYKYLIQGIWCEGSIYYGLYLVPLANSLHKDKRASVARFCGLDESEITPFDVLSYGCGVLMGMESVKSDVIEDVYLNEIATATECVDSLRGFYLDRYQDKMGATGWDYLEDYINGDDAVKRALNRVG